MAYKVLTKQQWDSLPSYKKYQMRANTPDLYNYYQDRYKPEPVAKREEPTTTEKRRETFNAQGQVIYDRGDTFDRYTGEDLDNTDPSASVQDFMRGMGEYFDRLNVSKDIRETTTAFVLGLQGMERNLFEVGIRQVLEQLDTGAENINNPLNEGFIGGLEYLEDFAPSLYDYFNDMFGDNETLSRSEVGDAFGISKEDLEVEAAGPTQSQITGKGSSKKIYDKEGNLVRLTYDGEVYTQDDSGQWVTQAPQDSIGDGGVTVLPAKTTYADGTEITEPDTSEETKVVPYIPYELPKDGAVDVTELTEEQQTDIWGKIKEGLGKIPGAIGKVIFGPDGMPTNVDEWIEWVDETLQAQMGPDNLPFPIVITTNPTEGTWIDLKIPINLDVNGNPIRIPLFDEDGNFVSSDELGKAWVDAKGQIFGPLGEIGEVFLDDDGNIKLDLGDLKDVLLEDLTLNPDGSVTGSTAAEILVGEWFFNSETGEWEEEEEVDINKDTVDDDTTDDDELGGLLEEEDPTPPTKAPRGRLITDKDGNPVRIIGTDGTNYVLDGEGQWVAAAVGEGDGGETVLPGTTTGGTEDTDDGLANDIDVPAGPVDKLPSDIEEVEVFEGDNGGDNGGTVDNGGTTGTGGTGLTPFDPNDLDGDGVPDDLGGPFLGDNGGDNGGGDDKPVGTGGTGLTPFDPNDLDGDGVPDDTVDPLVTNGDPDDSVVVTNGGDDGGDDGLVVTNGGDDGGDDGGPEEPIVGGPVIVEGGPEDPTGGGDPEEPLVGATGPAGAGGAAGRDALSGGMMGGLSYNLPGFVGVQYQPKDYTAELDRIINESLFKGMI